VNNYSLGALVVAAAFPFAAQAAVTVSFQTPSSGATISGTLQGSACEVAGTEIRRVQFHLDSTPLNKDNGSPWTCVLDTTRFTNGSHTLMAVAFDKRGNSTSTQISVNIQNGAPPPPPPPPAGVPTAVPTFESLGLYWSPASDPGASGCDVRYRKAGELVWNDGLAMWYDARNRECRGSLVHLTPGTTYEMEFSLPGQAPSAQLTAATWSETFPIAKVVEVPSGTTTLAITEGGTPSGYVLYTSPAGTSSTLDVANTQDYNVVISAPYVIVRGLTLRGARIHGVSLINGAKDVVIEDNDISGWGRTTGQVLGGVEVGTNQDSAIRADCAATPFLERAVIQRNKLHHPRYGANSWDYGHPLGPTAINFGFCGGNHVIRYNEIYSSDGQYFKDGMGGAGNFSANGFPVADTDIYGNRIMQAWDDAISSEGGNRNVRIWGNYIDQTAVGIATTVVHDGPLYMFRNVYNRSRKLSAVSLDADQRLSFAKSGTTSSAGGGRRYVFHNTLLQATQSGLQYPLGAGVGIVASAVDEPVTNTMSRNNILHVWKASADSIRTQGGTGNDFNYDLRNGGISAYAGAEPNGIVGTPIYAEGHGASSESSGLYQLAPHSAGYDGGARLPNFNDAFTGAAPDIGAHEAGTAAMRFGVR
jgi:hypothetical protein